MLPMPRYGHRQRPDRNRWLLGKKIACPAPPFPSNQHRWEALHWGQGGASGGAFGANVDSLHILREAWGASRKMLRSPRRAQVLSERQRVSNHRELRLLAYPWLDAGNGRLV